MIFATFGLFGTTFPLVASNKLLFALWYLALTSIERGLYTVIGPVLIKIFGLGMGSKVFPYKVTSWIVALAIAPTIDFALHSVLSMDMILVVLGLLVFVALWISTFLHDKYYW